MELAVGNCSNRRKYSNDTGVTMRAHLIRSAGLLIAGVTALGAQPSRRIALVGGTLIDGNGGRPIRNSVVLIEGERIKAIGATIIREPYEMGGGWIATLADPDAVLGRPRWSLRQAGTGNGDSYDRTQQSRGQSRG